MSADAGDDLQPGPVCAKLFGLGSVLDPGCGQSLVPAARDPTAPRARALCGERVAREDVVDPFATGCSDIQNRELGPVRAQDGDLAGRGVTAERKTHKREGRAARAGAESQIGVGTPIGATDRPDRYRAGR